MGSVVVKKAEKAEEILNKMSDIKNEAEFKRLFKENYSDDWKKINAKYNKEERDTKPGKTHPMPEPDTYLHNMYKVAVSKHKV